MILKFHDRSPELPVEVVRAVEVSSACRNCDLANGVRSVGVPAERVVSKKAVSSEVLLVVGEGPGRVEDAQNRPFVGPTGQYFRPLVESLWLGSVVYSNAVRCMAKTKVLPGHVEACRAHLASDLAKFRPDRVLCVGAVASLAVTGRSLPVYSMRRACAFLGQTPVLFVIHPAATFSNRFVRQWFEEDLRWALTVDLPPPRLDGEAVVVEDLRQARGSVDKLRDDFGRVDFDTETFGRIGDADFRVLTVAASAGLHAFVWDEGVLGRLADSPVVGPLLDLMADPSVRKGAQNAKFDLNALWFGLGCEARGLVDCSRTLRRLVQPDSPADLEAMQFLVGCGGWKDEGALAAAKAAEQIRKRAFPPKRQMPLDVLWMPADELDDAVRRVKAGTDPLAYAYAAVEKTVRARYCGMDAVTAGMVVDAAARDADADPGLSAVRQEILQGAQRAVVMMERNGVLIDRDAVRLLRKHLTSRCEALEVEMKQWGDFYPSSTQDVARMLFQVLGLKSAKATATGKPSVDAEVLAALDHPCARAIAQWRSERSWISRYCDGVEVCVRDDGRVHPNILVDGTETGRPSCSEPNMFNLPKASTPEGKMVRDVVVAPVGWSFLEVDQSQVELRVAAALAGDAALIGLFKSGVDVHLATAKKIAPLLGVDSSVVDKKHPLREQAKTVNFATLYGDSPESIATKLGITVQKARLLQRAIFGAFPQLAAWIAERLKFARACGFTRTYWRGAPARRRWLLKIAEPEDKLCGTAERSAWNTPVQGTAADITNHAVGQVQGWLDERDPRGEAAKLVLSVYDSVLLEVRDGRVDEVAQRVVKICEAQPLGEVPLVAEAKVGRAWGSMKAWEEGHDG